MALSDKTLGLLKQIYSHHRFDSDEGLVDENPDEALEYVLQEIVDRLSDRHRDSAPLHVVTESAVGGHNLARIERRGAEQEQEVEAS